MNGMKLKWMVMILSNYTTELRYIIESINGLKKPGGYKSINQLIENAIPEIFENFPIFDENYRNVLCAKILKYYYFYEIGTETKGRFLFELNETMNRIMPFYNKLYSAWLNEFNPLYTTDLTTEHTGSANDNDEEIASEVSKNNKNKIANTHTTDISDFDGTIESTGSASSETDGDTHNKNRKSDTPQGALTNIENNTYLSEATLDDATTHSETTDSQTNTQTTDNTTTNNSDTSNNENENSTNNLNKQGSKSHMNTNEYIDHVYGFSNTPSENLMKFQEALLNIDEMIIKDLSNCFMQIF